MSRQAIDTERLRLEPLSDANADAIVALAATPEVMRFIGDGSVWPRPRTEEVLATSREHWRRHGFGWRVAAIRETGAPVGLAALNFAGDGSGIDAGEYEIGWWLAPEVWRRGLGREIGVAVRDEAFVRLGAPSVVARIQAANQASSGLASAIGLTTESQSYGRAGEPFTVWRLTAQRWQQLTSDMAPAG
jgi:RimJ/RimL family protein N-acetyltransferase